jgi:antitoxin component YwqK of YwqJK toxin-antitoxin module
MRHLFLFLVMLTVVTLLQPEPACALEKIVRQDTNDDGKIDQIALFDRRGKLIRLEIDSNANEVMDRFQYYEKEQIIRVEMDTDHDQRIDTRDYFEAGKRIRHEKLSSDTSLVIQVIQFDSQERPLKIKKDTTGDGLFDSLFHFKDGRLSSSTRDTDADSKPNIWQTYRDDKPLQRHVDGDGDGRYDIITVFKHGKPHYQEKDSNFDGEKDVFIHFDADGHTESIEEDTRHTGRIDRIRTYHAGLPVKVIYDADGDGFKETITLFKEGKACRQTEDRNRDGRPDVTIYFNAKEEKEQVEMDTDLNCRIDTWEYYRDAQLARIERGNEGNGKICLKVFYKKGKKYKLIQDKDNDGCFEITQWFDRSPWTMVTEVDADGDKNPEGRYCYKKNILRLREIDEDSDGNPNLREHYNAQGRLARSEEDDEGVGRFTITWFYNDAEEAVRAEKDNNNDGNVDTWYHYNRGSVIIVEEDTNADGKPDLWEEYDESEALVKRSKDLNFDGEPDVEEWESEKTRR